MGNGRRTITGAGIGMGALLAVPAAAQAEDIRVTNLNEDGPGSLRAAVQAANADADSDRVVFKSKLSGTIDLDGDDIDFYSADVQVVGPGARKVTVSGGNAGGGVFSLFDYMGAFDAAISGLTIADGERTEGAGVRIVGDVDVELSRLTVTRNLTDGNQAGAVFFEGDGLGSLVVERSTVSGNQSTDIDAYGGGLYVGDGDFTLVNSTVSGNFSADDGGGMYITNNANAEIRNSTITGNRAEQEDGGGVYAASGADVLVRGTIVAGNTAGDAGNGDLALSNANSYSFSFSLVGDPGNHVISGSTNLLGANPKLKPLKNNGGPTDTHAFKKSPAKNKGPSDAPNQDQRGAPRKGKADIGAYELTKCKGVIVNRVGTAGKDKLKGTKKKDGILGLGGNDKLSGKKGKDGLCGGRGKDKLKGGPGKDKLSGGPGRDKEVQ
jgi:Right handed beta helix region/RTX calcium-binding nonapeptide repeat (4 copies)